MSSEVAQKVFSHIPDGWGCARLIDCTTDGSISYGIVQPGQHTDDGIPIIRVNNVNNGQLELNDVLRVAPEIEEKYKRTRLIGGEVLLTLVGSTGQSFVAPSQLAGWNVPRAIAVIRPKVEIGADWINICLQSKPVQHFLDVRANTTVQKTLNLKDIRDIPIPLPPEGIKEKIESIAVSLQGKIELNRQINQTLEHIAQAIFKSWFVDFEPVKAKIQAKQNGQDPERAAMCAISGKTDAELDAFLEASAPEQRQQLTATAALFPGELEDPDPGSLPKGWAAGDFGNIAENVRDVADPKNVALDTPYVGLEHIERKKIYISNWGSAGQVESNKSRFNAGDILFGKLRPYFHKVCFMPFAGISSTDILVVRSKSSEWSGYVQFQLFEDRFVDYANLRSTGTRMPRASWKDMSKYQIALPSVELAAAFNAIVKKFNNQAATKVDESKTLGNIRDSLLPKLLSGELRIKAA